MSEASCENQTDAADVAVKTLKNTMEENIRSQSLPTIVFIIALFVGLLVLVLYLLTLANALKKCAPASRTMKPAKVWLTVIPFFGLVWQFIVVLNVTKSLTNEFARREIPHTEPSFGQGVGLASCVCNCCLILPVFGNLAGLVGLVFWIIYWNKIKNYSRLLGTQQPLS